MRVASYPHEIPDFPLLEEDGVPMESFWHVAAMNLLIDLVYYRFRKRKDFFAGGNMFIYFSAEQARNLDYRGPDFFFVWGVKRSRRRRYWAVWEEKGKFPNVIIELLSQTTAEQDLTTKKDLYQRTFRTPDYFCYDPETEKLLGWRLTRGRYVPLTPNKKGWLWSEELQLWVGTWVGEIKGSRDTWPRFYDAKGNLVLTGEERADAAEAELARLKTRRAKARTGKNSNT